MTSDQTSSTAQEAPGSRGASQVRRVQLYTEWSLYALLLLTPVVALPRIFSGSEGTGVSRTLTIGLVLAQTLLACELLRRTMRHRSDPARAEWVVLGVMAVVVLVGMVLPAQEQRSAVVLAAVYTGTLAVSPMLGRRGVWGMTALATVLCIAAVRDEAPHVRWTISIWAVFAVLFLLFTVRVTLWLLDVVRELDAARATQGALAVAEERLRFGRDVHDVLGRSLSSIAVKSELAAELGRRGDDRAPAQMLEVRGLAHEALRETRELVRGYRRVDLDAELAGARSLLESAGIRVVVALDPALLSPEQAEAAGWVVREGVTNVLRHSRADRCHLTLEGEVLTVSNDKADAAPPGSGSDPARGPRSAATPGSGLTGLRERLEAAGGSLEVASRRPDRFVLTATLPPRGA